jgi:Fur family transcriptional regulator, ferric uptake regulator
MQTHILDHALKEHRVSLTKPRKQVYEVLSHNEPLTMQELIALLPDLDKTTVYRTVELFEKLGIVQRLQIGFKYKVELSNQYQEHHHHVTCMRCGQTTALPEDELLEDRLAELARAQGYDPKDHQIEVRGLCSNCRNSA